MTALPTALKRRQIGLLSLVMVTFFIVSGGPFGLEELVSASGPGLALLLIVVTPLIWAVPSALAVAELSSMMPVEGGYYAWVKRALGPFWGFQEGWWSWLQSFVDMAIYPVLFASYLSALLERLGLEGLGDDPIARWLPALGVIWAFTLLNVLGARPVGLSSILFGAIVLAPFVVMSYLGLSQLAEAENVPWQPLVPADQPLLNAFGVGLFIVMWNYSGWDSPSTVGEEITRPARAIPLTLLITVPLITLVYLLPVLAGLVGTPDWTAWEEGSLPEIAAAVGGDWLGVWVAAVGMVSAAALFSGNLLSVSRLPFVMAADGYFPRALAGVSARYGTPVVSIVLCSAIYSLFSYQEFSWLVVVDVILYAASILLELAALVALRVRRPDARRPYRVPFGWAGIAVVVVLPTLMLALAIVATLQDAESTEAVYVAGGALLSGVALYPLLRFAFKRGAPDVFVPLDGDGNDEGWLDGALPRLVPKARPTWR
ncbi:MAG TPA: APC family permease [Chloroflexota bacterium]|nr:APC family permease [Chloroflexota bacterium]